MNPVLLCDADSILYLDWTRSNVCLSRTWLRAVKAARIAAAPIAQPNNTPKTNVKLIYGGNNHVQKQQTYKTLGTYKQEHLDRERRW